MSADVIDNACELEELQRQEAINKHKKGHTHQPLYIDGIRCCIDCEEDITKRIEILPDVVRCVICQEKFEKQYGMNI